MYGWMIGFGLVIFLAFLIEAIGLGGYQFFIGIGMGLGVGYMQGRVLSLYFGINYRWVLYSVIGMGFSFILFDFGKSFSTLLPEYNLLYSVSLGGLITAVLQYLLLKERFPNALPWLLYCFAGWTLSGALIRFTEIMESIGLTGLPAAIIVLIILTIGASATLGLITGIGLRRITRT